MLKINTNFKKYRIPIIAGSLVIAGVGALSCLTYVPNYSSAKSVSTGIPSNYPEINNDITTKFGTDSAGYKTYLQEITLDYCQSLPEETTGQLADGRDGKVYWVTVLGTGDAKTCWMTQDLDLDLGPDGPALTTENTGDNLFRGTSLGSTQTSWTGAADVGSSDSGWTTTEYDNVNWYERNKIHGTRHESLGNLYSFEAATAGTGSAATTKDAEATGSICPTGWRLPLGGLNSSVNMGAGSFNSLKDAGMTTNIIATSEEYPYQFQYGGLIKGSLNYVDVYGRYWSSISYNGNSAHIFYFNTDGSLNTIGYNERYRGFSVRCTVRDNDPNVLAAINDAATNPYPSSNPNPQISVIMNPMITLDVVTEDADSNNINVEVDPNYIKSGKFSAIVTSTYAYNLSIKAAEGYSTALTGREGNTVSIPALTMNGDTATEELTPKTNKWGIRACVDNNMNDLSICNNNTDSNTVTNNTNFKGLTTNDITYFTSNDGAIDLTIPFEVGVTVSPTLPSDTYSTSMTITASQR